MAFSILRVLTATWCDWIAVDIAGRDDDLRELLLSMLVVAVADVGGGVGEEEECKWWCNLGRLFCGDLERRSDELWKALTVTVAKANRAIETCDFII